MGNGDLVPYQQPGKLEKQAPQSRALERAEARSAERWDSVKADAAGKAVNVVADVIGVMIKHGEVAAKIKEMEAESAQGWETTNQQIALIDANTRSKLGELERHLAASKDRTDTIARLVNYMASLGPNPNPVFAQGINQALANLTAPNNSLG